MFDNFGILLLVFGILGILAPIALVALIIYGIVAWRRRASEPTPNADDPGIGTVRRLYFYIVAFISLMMTVSGIVMLIEFILDTALGSYVISDSTVRLAAGASLLIVGAPLWYFHWRYIQRVVLEQPVEARSVLRKLYIYITLAVAGSILIYTALNVLSWIFRTDDFSGYDLSALIIWGAVWVFHWFIEEREGQSTLETHAIRRLYIYIASLVGLAMLSISVVSALHFVLQEGYDVLADAVVISRQSWHTALREMLPALIVGAAIWASHWLYIARRDYDSVLRQVYLYIFAILGGVVATLTALGIIIHEFLTWLFGVHISATVAQSFENMPGSAAALIVGVALWAYHWHRMRSEAEESAGTTLSARRAYTYILTAIGTGALAIAIFMLVSAAIKLVLASFGDVVVGGEQWKRPLINVITLAVLGGPVWGYYWRNIQSRTLALETDERRATSRRIFLFVALGIGVLALLGSVSALLFVFLRGLLDVSLSLATLDDMVEPIAIIVAAAAFLPYYWGVYRQDQDAAPEISVQPDPAASEEEGSAESQSSGKAATLLATEGSALAQQLSALGCEVSMLRWVDSDAAMPVLSDEECARLAQSIYDAPGSYVLLIPDGGTVRVLSHD
jgi:hypothetical protein